MSNVFWIQSGSLLVSAFILASMPFELMIAITNYHFFESSLTNASLFLHPFIYFFVFYILCSGLSPEIFRSSLALRVAFICAIPSVIHALSGRIDDARFFLLGIMPILAGIIFHDHNKKVVLGRVLAASMASWCIVVIFAWIFDFYRFIESHQWAKAMAFDELLLAIRYPESISIKMYYPYLVGNWNKAANLVLISYLCVAAFSLYDLKYRNLYFATLALLLSVLFLSYSRGAFVVSVVICGTGIFVARKMEEKPRNIFRLAMLLMVVPTLLTILMPATRAGWSNFSSMETRVTLVTSAFSYQNFWDTDVICLEDSDLGCKLSQALVTVERALIGLGTGAYGRDVFDAPEAGTHNMYLDLFFSGGLLQVISIAALLGLSLFQAFRNRADPTSAIGGLGVVAVVVLSIREFDLNYLGVISLVSFHLGILIGNACRLADDERNFVTATSMPLSNQRSKTFI